jgi:hypothetical protein
MLIVVLQHLLCIVPIRNGLGWVLEFFLVSFKQPHNSMIGFLIKILRLLDVPTVDRTFVNYSVHFVLGEAIGWLCVQNGLTLPTIGSRASKMCATPYPLPGLKMVAARRAAMGFVGIVGLEDLAAVGAEERILIAASAQHVVVVQANPLAARLAGHHLDPADVDDVGIPTTDRTTRPV